MKYYPVLPQKLLLRLRVQEFDVAIVGGGLVGAVFARAIADLGLRIVLIDQAPATQLYHPSLDNRGLALAYSTIVALKNIRVWDALSTHAHAIDHVHVSQQKSFGFTKLSALDAQIPHLGFVLSASELGRALIEDLDQLPHLSVLRPTALIAAKFLNAELGWELQTTEQNLKAKFLVAADGTNSLMRKFVGLGLHTKDFAQSALVTNVLLNKTHANIAYERFTDLGVLALLPFGKQQMKCILTVATTKIPELLNLNSPEFLKTIQQLIGYRAGVLTDVSERKAFPIITAYIDKLYAQNVFFMGNAANTLHPVAAQGFNLGVRDAMALANILRLATQVASLNADQLGLQYINARKVDQQRAQEFSNHLVEIFATDLLPIRTGRKLGLLLAEFVPSVKAKLIAQGLGLCM